MIASSTKTEAEVLRYCLREGLTSLDDVIVWADSQILRQPEPEYVLIELALARGRLRQDVLHLLGNISGEADWSAVLRGIFARMLVVLEADISADTQVARLLYMLAIDEPIPEYFNIGEMLSFWDSLDLAKEGYYGDVEAIRAELLAFLKASV